MKSPSSPNSRSQPRPGYAAGEADWFISPSTRQRAQEADASMVQEGSQYTPRNPTGPDLPIVEHQYFLP